MTDEKRRKYRMKRRAEAQERTRLRITESAVELHGTVGPSRTTIKDIASLAGVRRSTVYRHFPDEATLFAACSSHWAAANPPPDLAPLAQIAVPSERLAAVLEALYAYYEPTEHMIDNIFRDEPVVPTITRHLVPFRAYLEALRNVLMEGRHAEGPARRRLLAAIGHALAFRTWQSLVRHEGLSNTEGAALAHAIITAAAPPAVETFRRNASTHAPHPTPPPRP
jgi:AcrR family transcriptional regulator